MFIFGFLVGVGITAIAAAGTYTGRCPWNCNRQRIEDLATRWDRDGK